MLTNNYNLELTELKQIEREDLILLTQFYEAKAKSSETEAELLKLKYQQEKDEERHNYLMKEVYRLHSLLGTPEPEKVILKSMTTDQLDDYVHQLRTQLQNIAVKRLKVA